MQYIIKYLKTLGILERIFLSILIIILCMATHHIFIGTAAAFDGDLASYNVLAREQILSGQVIPSEWRVGHDIRLIYLNLIIVFLTPLGLDQLLMRSIAVFIQSIGFLAVLLAYGKHVFKDKSYLFYVPIIFSYISFLYANFVFGNSAYGYESMVVLFSFMLLSLSINETCKLDLKHLFFSSLLIFYLSITGTRYFAVLLLPVIISFALSYLIEYHNESYHQVLPYIKKFTLWCVCIIIFALLGFSIYRWIAANRFVEASVSHPILRNNINEIIRSFIFMISGIWAYFGIGHQAELFSLRGVAYVIRYFASFIFLFGVPFCLTKQYKNESIVVKRLIIFSWTGIALTAFIALFTPIMVNPEAARYFITNIVLSMILSGYFLYKYMFKKSFLLGSAACIMLLAILFSFNFERVNYIVSHRPTRSRYLSESMALRDALRDRGLSVGYASNWHAHSLTVKFEFNPHIAPVLDFDENTAQLAAFPVLVSTAFYDYNYHTDNTFLLLSYHEHEFFQSNIFLQYTLGEPIEVFEKSGYIILVFDYNIASTFQLPW